MRPKLLFLLLLLLLAACEPATAPTPAPRITATPAPPTPTDTPAPPTNTSPPSATSTATEEITFSGRVSGSNVNLFTDPSGAAPIIRIIRSSAPLTLVGRTEDNAWVEARFADGVTGWLLTSTVDSDVDVSALNVTGVADSAPVLAATPTTPADARVRENAGGLRLREAPNTDSDILENLDGLTALNVYGRTADNTWLRVQEPGGTIGWVAAEYLEIDINLNQVAVIRDFVTPTALVQAGQPNVVGVVVGISDRAREIFRQGQEQGNRANVFSKVGDSLTVAAQVFNPIGQGSYNLGRYTALQATIDYFTAVDARDGNSFVNPSLAANSGWTTEDVLNPANANPAACQPGDSPLVCEYRVVRPAVALIMLGTNDVAGVELTVYRANLQGIVQTSIDMGVIPVLSTIPVRQGYDVTPYNQVIAEIAAEFQTPLWDYTSAMQTAPANGLSDDGVHPSHPPGDPALAADFSLLQYGYNIRNLTALQVLDALRQNVLQL